VLLFIILMSGVEIFYFWNFRIYEWDMGIWNQAFSSTLAGNNMHYNSELFLNRDGNFLATHFAPAVYLFLPFYSIYPSVEMLLIIHTVILGLGAGPVYRIAEQITGNRKIALFFGILYLALPATWGVTISGLHLEDIFLVSTLCYIAGFVQKKPFHYAFFGILSCLSIEWAAIPMVLFAFSGLLNYRKLDRRMIYLSLSLILFAALWLYFATQMRYALGLLIYNSPWKEWEIFGANNIMEVPLRIFQSPGSIPVALAFQAEFKASYLILIFLPLGFLPILRPLLLLPTVPWFLISLLSNYGGYYYLWNQYPAFILPFLLFAGITASKEVRWERISSRLWGGFSHQTVDSEKEGKGYLSRHSIITRLSKNPMMTPRIIPILAIFCIVSSGLSLTSVGSILGSPINYDHSIRLHNIINQIPINASVLTQNNIFAQVSSRSNAYTIPSPMWGESFVTAGKKMLGDLRCDEIEFVLIDYNMNPYVVAGGDLINQSFVQRCNTGSIIFLIQTSTDGIVLFHNSLYLRE
jgi:uncharacterized membrane protein